MTTTEYDFLGATKLKAWEIVCHYLWWPVALPASVAPSLSLIGYLDGHGGGGSAGS